MVSRNVLVTMMIVSFALGCFVIHIIPTEAKQGNTKDLQTQITTAECELDSEDRCVDIEIWIDVTDVRINDFNWWVSSETGLKLYGETMKD